MSSHKRLRSSLPLKVRIFSAVTAALVILPMFSSFSLSLLGRVAKADAIGLVRDGDPTHANIDCEAYISGANKDYKNTTPAGNLALASYNFDRGNSRSIYDEYGFALTENAIDTSQNLVWIYFYATQLNNDQYCYSSLTLFQNEDPTGDKKTFYGYWLDESDPNSGSFYDLVKATVNPQTATLTFTSLGKSFTIHINEEPGGSVLSNAGYFPGTTPVTPGGGDTSTGPCYGLTGYPLQSCMESLTPHFTDMANIVYNGETYTATVWSGIKSAGGFRYFLSKSSIPGRTENNITKLTCRPYFDLDLDPNDKNPGDPSNGIDLDFDGDGNGAIDDSMKWLSSLASGGNSTPMKYVSYNANCESTDEGNIDVQGVHNMSTFAGYYADGTIVTLLGTGGNREGPYIGVYTKNATNPLVFEKPADEGCTDKSTITLDRDIAAASVGSEIGAIWNLLNADGSDCAYIASASNITVVKQAADATLPPVTTVDPTGEGGGEASQPTCEDSVDGGFGWLVCWIIDGADKLIGWMEGIIQSQLEVDTSFFTNEDLKSAWTQVARISSGLLVIVGLAMVISTALGFSMFDAYTVKKVLPKLVIAAVFIWLSWGLVTTYVTIMNDVGKGIADLLFSPFGNFSEVDLGAIVGKATASSGGGSDAVFSGLLLGGMVAAVLASGGVFAVLAALVPVIAFIAIGFVVLVFRQAIIIFLVVMAPLGIAAWILPNTEKIWKLWSGTLNKLLIMFPLFMGIFAAAKIFAWTTAGATGGAAEVVVTVLAYVSPFIFLPALFKAAGGLLSNITGVVNNKGKGMFDKVQGNLDAKAKSAKAFKDQVKKERLVNSAGGGSRFSQARLRAQGGQPVFGGALNVRGRQAIQNRAASSLAAASQKVAQAQLEEQAVLSDAEYTRYANAEIAAGRVAMQKKAWAKDQATKAQAGSLRQQAMLDVLVKEKAVAELQSVYEDLVTSSSATGESKQSWYKATQRNFPAIREIAPHIATASLNSDTANGNPAQPSLNFEALATTSAGDAAKWKKETIQTALKMHAEGYHDFSGLADQVKNANDGALWKDLSPEIQAEFEKFATTGVGSAPRTTGSVAHRITGPPTTPPSTTSGEVPDHTFRI